MAAITSPAPKAQHAQITVTGATGAATKIFDATPVQTGGTGGTGEVWDLYIENLDADAGDTLFIGFTATTDTTDGWQLDPYAAATEAYRLVLRDLPWYTKVYANCTNAETRDVRLIAIPR
jgi:hypothetical protein